VGVFKITICTILQVKMWYNIL